MPGAATDYNGSDEATQKGIKTFKKFLLKNFQLETDIENHDEYFAQTIDEEAKRLEEIIWLAERIINIQIVSFTNWSL